MLLKGSCMKAIAATVFLFGSSACMNQGGALEILVCGAEDHAGEEAGHAHEDGTTHLHGDEGGAVPCSGAHAHEEEQASGSGDASQTQTPTPNPTDTGAGSTNQPTVPTPDTTTTTTPPADEHAGHDHP